MLDQICQLTREAGAAIMRIYNSPVSINLQYKADNSPVTTADIIAHQIILRGIQNLTPQTPILSEEDPPSWDIRQHWKQYWLIDPLDGTKEFIKRNGEFTVNIALIDQGKPIMGAVYAPALNLLYSAADGKAWKEESGHKVQIKGLDIHPPLVVISRSHKDEELEDYLSQLDKYQTISVGSSLKFCLVAEGKAQLYPRYGSTKIWDTGAGHAVALAAGAQVHDWKGRELNYTPRESFLNPGFRVFIF